MLQVPYGLPVHEVTLYLGRFRKKGRAANTIHFVCTALALLYRELSSAQVSLVQRLSNGRFLSLSELDRLAAATQYRFEDLEEEESEVQRSQNVVSLNRIAMRRRSKDDHRQPVDVQTQASRVRYIADFLDFISAYVGESLPPQSRRELREDTARALSAFRQHIPRVSRRAKIGARIGLTEEEQTRLVEVVRPDSPDNPWKRPFIRSRNQLIVLLLLATGMRRGELLGLQVRDILPNQPKLRIVRRADASQDLRTKQPGTKTSDREIELIPSIARALHMYLQERRTIRAARLIPQVFVSDDGKALSESSIEKIFRQLSVACPDLSVKLTSHVMRHTWNERFSEIADAMGLSEVVEERARNTQQGWAENSKTGATYTRRHSAKKGQEIALKLQEKLDAARSQ
ncbi:MAG: tyrosine-type recombinase/integrase [Curvibacter sp.]